LSLICTFLVAVNSVANWATARAERRREPDLVKRIASLEERVILLEEKNKFPPQNT